MQNKLLSRHTIAQNQLYIYIFKKVQISMPECILTEGFKQSHCCSVSVSDIGCQNIPLPTRTLTSTRPGDIKWCQWYFTAYASFRHAFTNRPASYTILLILTIFVIPLRASTSFVRGLLQY